MTKNAIANHTETALTDVVAVTTADSEDPAFASLGASLVEIRKLDGVLGYIIRSNVSAVLDWRKTIKLVSTRFFLINWINPVWKLQNKLALLKLKVL